MNRETRVGTNGKAVTILVPETPEDQADIDRLAAADEIDVHASFGDQREVRRGLVCVTRRASLVRSQRQSP